MIRRRGVAVGVGLSLLVFPGLGAWPPGTALAKQSGPREVTDDLGDGVVVSEVPERIVSLAPSNTEILFALGAGERVVGVTVHDDWPRRVRRLPRVGGFGEVDLELVVSLRPAAALERKHPGRWDVVVVDRVMLLVSDHLLLDPGGRAEDPLEPVRPGSGEDDGPAGGRIPVEDRVHAEIESLVATLATRPWVPVVVSNEVGAGIVPANRVARRFRDLLGTVNQGLARRADEVVLMVAGLAVPIASAEGANGP